MSLELQKRGNEEGFRAKILISCKKRVECIVILSYSKTSLVCLNILLLLFLFLNFFPMTLSLNFNSFYFNFSLSFKCAKKNSILVQQVLICNSLIWEDLSYCKFLFLCIVFFLSKKKLRVKLQSINYVPNNFYHAFPPYLPFGNRNAQNFFPKNFDFGGDYVFKIVWNLCFFFIDFRVFLVFLVLCHVHKIKKSI